MPPLPRSMGATGSKEDPYIKLRQHRDEMYRKQCEYRADSDRIKRQAAEQLRLGNKQGALNLARRLKQLLAQEKIIAGIVCNLDANSASLETKAMTSETMRVISGVMKTLGKDALSMNVVEQALEMNDDMAADLKEVAEALSLPYAAEYDDEASLLQSLQGEAMFVLNEAGAGLQTSDGEDFLAWARKEVRRLTDDDSCHETVHLPAAPTHALPPNDFNPRHPPVSHSMLM